MRYFVAWGALLALGIPTHAAEPLILVGIQKQLLVDDYVIAQKVGVSRVLGQVKKVGVVLEPTLPTDFKQRNPDGTAKFDSFGYRTTVLYNDHARKFQMWYTPGDSRLGVGYAESADGLKWAQPLVSRDGRSNLVLQDEAKEFSCSIDTTVPWGAADKFKGAGDSLLVPGSEVGLWHSADGLRWTAYNQGRPVTGRAADTANQILWDAAKKAHRLRTRTDLGATGGRGEVRGTRIMLHGGNLDRDPTAWKAVSNTIQVNVPRQEKMAGPNSIPRLQMEALTCWVYEGVYFGLMNVLTVGPLTGAETGAGAELDHQTRHEGDVIDAYIGISRDGLKFDQTWIQQRRPLVPRGPAGAFDMDMIQIASQVVTCGDEHWLYYAGFDERHHSRGHRGKIALAKLPIDRFAGLAAGDKPGSFTTKPFRLDGARIEVNVDAPDGTVQVEVLDAEGLPIPALSGPARLRAVNGLRTPLEWKSGQAALKDTVGRTVRLRFELHRAAIYAFQVISDP